MFRLRMKPRPRVEAGELRERPDARLRRGEYLEAVQAACSNSFCPCPSWLQVSIEDCEWCDPDER